VSWVVSRSPWHRTEVAYCEVTGQLLPPRHWVFEDGDRVLHARDEHCEELYWRYLRPRAEGGERAGAAT